MTAVEVSPPEAAPAERVAIISPAPANDVAERSPDVAGTSKRGPQGDMPGLRAWLLSKPNAPRGGCGAAFGVCEGTAQRLIRELVRLGLIPNLRHAVDYSDDQKIRAIELVQANASDADAAIGSGMTRRQVVALVKAEGLPSASARVTARREATERDRAAAARARAEATARARAERLEAVERQRAARAEATARARAERLEAAERERAAAEAAKRARAEAAARERDRIEASAREPKPARTRPYHPRPSAPMVGGTCAACGRKTKLGLDTCWRCAPRSTGLPTRNAGRPPKPRDEGEVEDADVELYQPPTPYTPHVRNLAAEKVRADERARLLSALPGEKIKRLPSAPDLYREAIERNARFAEERAAEEARADAARRAVRHADYLRQRARERRQDALDRRDRIGVFAFDGGGNDRPIDTPNGEFRRMMIASQGERRSAAAIACGLGEGMARAIVAKLIAEGLIPARTRAERNENSADLSTTSQPASNDAV